jgi:hypothetical protein
MWEQVGSLVTVPNVVGLRFDVADGVARDHGVTIANMDPDGPPIGALAWRRLVYVSSQQPAAASIVTRNDSVRVELVDQGDAGDREVRPDPQPPTIDAAHAAAEQERFIDLT